MAGEPAEIGGWRGAPGEPIMVGGAPGERYAAGVHFPCADAGWEYWRA